MRLLKYLGNTLLLASLSLAAPADRITARIDGGQLAVLSGHLRALASSYADEGLIAPSQQMDGLILFLKPSAAQKASLDQLLMDLQDHASSRYHEWLTPEQYAEQFAISEADAAKIANWLESQGTFPRRIQRNCGRSGGDVSYADSSVSLRQSCPLRQHAKSFRSEGLRGGRQSDRRT
jgi:hypothetical protein